MKYFLTINGREHTLELARGDSGALLCRLDAAPFEAEAAEIAPGVYSLLIGGKSFHVRITPSPEHRADSASGDSTLYSLQVDGATYDVAVRDPRRWRRDRSGVLRQGPQQITAPMPGKVVRILVAENQRVEAGQGMIVVEAMKMQNEIKARAPGLVAKVLVAEGQLVTAGEALLVIE